MNELDESGNCPVCDGKIQTATPVAEARSRRSRVRADKLEERGSLPIDDGAQKSEQLPQWRLELNRKLQKIKQDREALQKKADRGQLPLDILQDRSDVPAQKPRIARKAPRHAPRETTQPPLPESADRLPYPVDVSSSDPEPVGQADGSTVPLPHTVESAPQHPVDPTPLLRDSSPEVRSTEPGPSARTEASPVSLPHGEESAPHYPVDPASLLPGSSRGVPSTEPEPVAMTEASAVPSPLTEKPAPQYLVDPASPLPGGHEAPSTEPEPVAEGVESAVALSRTEESLSLYPADPASPDAASPSGGSKPEPVAEAAASVAALPAAGEPVSSSNPVEIETLIDSVMTREAIQTRASELPETIISPKEARDDGGPEKLILLSRTLSGLVDLIIVFLCGSAFILLTDMVSGITVFDSRSVIHYSLLLVVIFLLYSLFFLGTANQTIGMMITNLRVVGKIGNRPTFARLLIRCAAYLLSLLGLGAGLIWGFFDADSDCLQDKLSQTRVVRAA